MKSFYLKTAVTAVLMAATAVAFGAPPDGKGPGTGGGPPDGKGNKPDTEVGFSLSVPAIIVGEGSKFLLNCPEGSWSGPPSVTGGEPVLKSADCADTVTGDGIAYCMAEGDYFVQRQHAWQASCTTAGSASVNAAWGDNLTGDAMLKVGSPIRVEIVLFDSTTDSEGELGYYVIKLQPDELDRNSDYGHLADVNKLAIARAVGEDVAFPFGLPDPHPITFEPLVIPEFHAVVYDAEAELKIELLGDDGYEVYNDVAGAEINATGKIVYGHNLRVGLPGTYRLTYTFPNIAIDSVDIGVFNNANGVAQAILDIEVAGGGGGGGKKGGN